MDFSKQKGIFDPEKEQSKVTIIGVGSTGSFTALTIAKMGIKRIRVIDFDEIEEHNIPNQYYREKDIGKKKTEAIKEIIKEFSGTEIETIEKRLEKGDEIELEMGEIIINCVDNMESRENTINAIEDLPVILIDTRFGGEGYSIHCVDCTNSEEIKEYKKGLKEKIAETTCGEKGVIYTINSLASEVANIVKRTNKGESNAKIIIREMGGYRFISNKK